MEKMYYLMVKEIEQTGLKCLCKRIQVTYLGKDDHLEYTGSGRVWKRILKAHPEYTLKTTVLGLYNKEELAVVGKYYSDLWNVVKSKEWANLIDEVGDGGVTHSGTSPFIHNSNTGRVVYRKSCPEGYIPYVPPNRPPLKRIHNPVTKKIFNIDINDPIPDGYVLGGVKGVHSYGPEKGVSTVYHNGTNKIYVKNGDPIPDGYVKGLHYEGTTKGRIAVHDPITGRKKYIKTMEDLPEGWVVGLKPTSGLRIQTPYGVFPSFSDCIEHTGLTRSKIQKFLKTNPTDWKLL